MHDRRTAAVFLTPLVCTPRLRRTAEALLVATVLASAPADASSLLTEMTVGRGWISGSLLGDLSLIEDRLFLTTGYTGARPGPGAPLSHQLALGADWTPGTRWLLSTTASLSPRSAQSVPITRALEFRATNASSGVTLATAFDSAGLSFFEYGFDASLGLTGWTFTREYRTTENSFLKVDRLAMWRPSAGAVVILDGRTELSVRGAYYAYSQDPLTAGRITEEERMALERRFATQIARSGAEDVLAAYLLQTLGGRLLEADAVSGLPTAPLHWEARASATRRFGERWRGQLAYTYARYVPSQGYGQVISTRWTLRASEAIELWMALALQIDAPENAPRTGAGLLTVGAQFQL